MSRSSRLGRRTALQALASAGLSAALPGLALAAPNRPGPMPPPGSRRYRMGFSPTGPRFTIEDTLQGIDLSSKRAELTMIHEELPWAKLLAGQSPAQILTDDKLALVAHLRSKGLALFFMLDLTNGLGREGDAPALVAAGRSLTEPAVQELAQSYAEAVDQMLQPAWLGLAAETNLVRQIAPPPLYAALRDTANAIDAALAQQGSQAKRFVSVQVETAWGRLGTRGNFVGIEQDLIDFPFTRALGFSSYPYFAWDDPAEIPADYYTRVRGSSSLPVIVTEGGWTSASVSTIQSSAEKQGRFIARHAELLRSVKAIAWCHLLFADLDLAALPQPLPELLPLFAQIGLVDPNFGSKPALAEWDKQFERGWKGV
jgi:hypothetical protein